MPRAVPSVVAQDVVPENAPEPIVPQEWIVDIHQHTWYLGRTDAELLRHQKVMGVWKTILLPAGRSVIRESTHSGRSNGLDATVNANRNAYELACQHPDHFVFFANEIPGLPDTRRVLEHWLRLGAVGIGEQKFNIAVDSPAMKEIYAIAREFSVPVLMHFQEGAYNHDLLKFHHVLEEFHDVHFIGHAQTWWGNIDKNHDQKILYPPGPVVLGGVTDELLRNHGNLFADHSAGSGLNALLRDPDHTREFLHRHQDQLLFGSDCPDKLGAGPSCHGTQILKTIRQSSPSPIITSKILSSNARRLFRI
jgi:predicted TIM-barrel fold metal-dependent hydrolase